MYYVHYVLCTFIALHNTADSFDKLKGWNYINLHCRDNNNKPVDWWYIFKPPSDTFLNMDGNDVISYITPDTAGRWRISDKSIIANSMLQHTLSPAFRPTYVDCMAMLKYDQRNGSNKWDRGTLMHGTLMADEVGGLWLTHTVPGFPDFSKDRLTFPIEESRYGHMFMCMSLDLMTLNQIAATLKLAEPEFTKVHIPPAIRPYVPDWYLNIRRGYRSARLKTIINFQTSENLPVTMMVRRPGETRCLYKKFARKKSIVLDVYGHRDHQGAVCENNYSVRHIDSISLKNPDQVLYISNVTDRTGFAVSTAAHWQRAGAETRSYWACVHSPDDGLGKAGLVVCVEDYAIWLSFDNLKINEPGC